MDNYHLLSSTSNERLVKAWQERKWHGPLGWALKQMLGIFSALEANGREDGFFADKIVLPLASWMQEHYCAWYGHDYVELELIVGRTVYQCAHCGEETLCTCCGKEGLPLVYGECPDCRH